MSRDYKHLMPYYMKYFMLVLVSSANNNWFTVLTPYLTNTKAMYVDTHATPNACMHC